MSRAYDPAQYIYLRKSAGVLKFQFNAAFNLLIKGLRTSPPYIKELNNSLHDSLSKAAFTYIDYLMQHKSQLKVVHLWLSESYIDLEERLNQQKM